MISNVYNALFAFSVFSRRIPEGTFFEKANRPAALRNNIPTPIYKIITFDKLNEAICSSVIAAVVPNRASATTNGPIEVPKELTAPPKVTRLVPVAGSPNVMANGCAAVCCLVYNPLLCADVCHQ